MLFNSIIAVDLSTEMLAEAATSWRRGCAGEGVQERACRVMCRLKRAQTECSYHLLMSVYSLIFNTNLDLVESNGNHVEALKGIHCGKACTEERVRLFRDCSEERVRLLPYTGLWSVVWISRLCRSQDLKMLFQDPVALHTGWRSLIVSCLRCLSGLVRPASRR